jgi:hypothetical protein
MLSIRIEKTKNKCLLPMFFTFAEIRIPIDGFLYTAFPLTTFSTRF